MIGIRAWLLVAFAAGLGAGCGSVGPLHCGALPPACGGNVSGAWKISSVCPATASTGAICPVTVANDNITATGTFTFANGSLTAMLSEAGTAQINFGAACFAAGYDCTKLSSMDETITQVCSAAASGCSCNDTFHVSRALSGTYSSNGTKLVVMFAGSTAPTTYDYCVENNMLVLANPTATTGGTVTGSNSSIVFTKM